VYDTNVLTPRFPNDQNPSFTNGYDTGTLMVLDGDVLTKQSSYNILITKCEFLSGYNQITSDGLVSNVVVQGCSFLWSSNFLYGDVGFYGYGSNLVFLMNTFNGNTNLVPTNYSTVGTNAYYTTEIAAVGIAWLAIGGNFFIAGNTILNNFFEGVQVNEGPASVVGNTYSNLCNNGAACALCATGIYGYSPWNSTCFIGNSVYGGRLGQRGDNGFDQTTNLNTLNFSGNSLNLYPAYNGLRSGGQPGAAVAVRNCGNANVCGNTMSNGGYAFYYEGSNNASALLLNNNFASASYCGIGYLDSSDSLSTALIVGNTLGQGVNFHLQLTYTNSFGWFAASNIYLNINSNTVPLYSDPVSSALHVFNNL
jgi:hypothetical protein